MDDWTLIGRVAPFRDASAYAASSGALNLSQGLPEPLFDNAMNAALARQVRAGWQYADPRGEMILRESIAGHNAGYAPDTEVLVTSGVPRPCTWPYTQLPRNTAARSLF